MAEKVKTKKAKSAKANAEAVAGLNKKQRAASGQRRIERLITMRNTLWPHVSEGELWERRLQAGFTTTPRTFPLIQQVLNSLEKGKPLFSTYFALWCHCWDASIVEIENAKELAFESGYASQRGELTWRERMQLLVKFGFIEASPGASGPFHYVLLRNPHLVLSNLYAEGIFVDKALFGTLQARALKVGAADLVHAFSSIHKKQPSPPAAAAFARRGISGGDRDRSKLKMSRMSCGIFGSRWKRDCTV